MAVPKGLSNRPRLNETSYQQAVAETVADLRNGYSDQEFAELWGISAGTVNNAQNKKHALSGVPLLKLGERFGPDALDTVLSLIGARAVAVDAVTIDVATIPCEVAKTLPLLIELFGDGHCSNADVRALDRGGVIDCLGKVADMLRQRRDGLRLEAVA